MAKPTQLAAGKILLTLHANFVWKLGGGGGGRLVRIVFLSCLWERWLGLPTEAFLCGRVMANLGC